jgi:hypothetical protein
MLEATLQHAFLCAQSQPPGMRRSIPDECPMISTSLHHELNWRVQSSLGSVHSSVHAGATHPSNDTCCVPGEMPTADKGLETRASR